MNQMTPPPRLEIIPANAPFNGGTTDDTIAPSSVRAASPTSCRVRIPYSSAVRSRAVANRHEPASLSPW